MNDYFTFFYVKHFELPMCMKCAIQINLPCLALPCLTLASYSCKHEPRQTGRGGGVATIYSVILNFTQKTGHKFNSIEILVLNVTL